MKRRRDVSQAPSRMGLALGFGGRKGSEKEFRENGSENPRKQLFRAMTASLDELKQAFQSHVEAFSKPLLQDFFKISLRFLVGALKCEALIETLETRGVLGQVKAKVRAEIFAALDDEKVDRPELPPENVLINEMIREYLEHHINLAFFNF